MKYRRGRITQEYRRWGSLAHAPSKFRALGERRFLKDANRGKSPIALKYAPTITDALGYYRFSPTYVQADT